MKKALVKTSRMKKSSVEKDLNLAGDLGCKVSCCYAALCGGVHMKLRIECDDTSKVVKSVCSPFTVPSA